MVKSCAMNGKRFTPYDPGDVAGGSLLFCRDFAGHASTCGLWSVPSLERPFDRDKGTQLCQSGMTFFD